MMPPKQHSDRPRLRLLILWIVCGPPLGLPAAGAEVLWQIGVFDQSSAEFKPMWHPSSGERLIDYSDPAQDPVYHPGRSSPSGDWLAFQPGSANGQAGFREHPFTVEFELRESPLGPVLLEMSLLAYSARLPSIEVRLNGQVGRYHQRPRLSYEGGDPAVFFQPHYSHAEIRAILPADAFRKGSNRLTLVAMDDPPERDDTRPYGFPWPGSSGVVYDALRLSVPDDVSRPPQADAGIYPTPFYRSRDGRIHEELEVVVPRFGPEGTLKVSLHLGTGVFRQERRSARRFGEEFFVFEAPDFSPAAEVLLRVEQGGKVVETRHQLNAARKWELLVMPSAHLDVGYTDYAGKVAEVQSRSLDRILEVLRQRPDFRFTLDGFWIVEEFLKGRGPLAREELLGALRRGQIAIPACYGSGFTGFSSLENLIRTHYPAHQFARTHGLPFNFSLNTDVPSYSWSYASALAACGISNFVAASDAYRAPFVLYNRLNEQSPHWWEGPDGSRVFTWIARHYHQVGSLFAMPPRIASGRQSLGRFLQAYDRPEYATDLVLLHGTQVENIELHPAQADLVAEWNREYAYPRMRFAGFGEAMQELARAQQAKVGAPVVRGDGGPYWEDGLGANAAITAAARRNMVRITTAEFLGAASHWIKPGVVPDRALLEDCWRRLLLTDEHSWHADCSTREPQSFQSLRQGEEKDARTHEARRQIDYLVSRGISALSDGIPNPPGTVVVVNSLSWPRSGTVAIDVNRGSSVVDLSTGQPVEQRLISQGRQLDRVEVAVHDVPPLGYRCYTIRPGLGRKTVPSEVSDSAVMENPHYRIVLDAKSGVIREIVDKALRRNLLKPGGGFDFNQFVYVTGADELPNRLVQYSTVTPVPDLTLHRAHDSRLVSLTRLETGWEAVIESRAERTPRIRTFLRLPSHIRRIEIENQIHKEPTLAKEAAYFAFPFQVESPRFRWATQNGFVDPERDSLPGACREWFCVQEYMAVEGDGVAITVAPVDAPLMSIGDVVRGTWPREFGRRPALLFSYVMNNYTPEGYRASQGGDVSFRYWISSGPRFDPVASHRLGREAMTPFEVNEVTRNDKLSAPRGSLSPARESLMEVNTDALSLVTWKMAEDGRGTVLRWVEVAGRSGRARLRSPVEAIRSATFCNAVEAELSPLVVEPDGVEFSYQPFQILTIRIQRDPPP